MTKGKSSTDKEESFIKRLDKLEEQGKERQRSGLDELLDSGDDEAEAPDENAIRNEVDETDNSDPA